MMIPSSILEQRKFKKVRLSHHIFGVEMLCPFGDRFRRPKEARVVKVLGIEKACSSIHFGQGRVNFGPKSAKYKLVRA